MQQQKLMDSQQLQQSSVESLQENEICCVSHVENDIGFGIFVENINFLNNKDFQIKIVPAKDPYNRENPQLYLTVVPIEDSEENEIYTGIIDFKEEFQKQKYLDIIYDDEDLELKDMGSIFAEYFSKNEYQFVQNIGNENQVQLEINTKLELKKKEKDVKFEFLLIKKIVQQEQNLEKLIKVMQKTIKSQNKENLKLQNEIKNQNQEQKQILEYMQTFITEKLNSQNEKIEKMCQMEKEFQIDIQKNFKMVQQENSDLKQNIQNLQDKLTGLDDKFDNSFQNVINNMNNNKENFNEKVTEIRNLMNTGEQNNDLQQNINNIKEKQVQNFENITQQLTNLQAKQDNSDNNNNNQQNLNDQITELRNQINTINENLQQQKNMQQQNQQELKQVLQQNQNNNNNTNLQNINELNANILKLQLQTEVKITEDIKKEIQYQFIEQQKPHSQQQQVNKFQIYKEFDQEQDKKLQEYFKEKAKSAFQIQKYITQQHIQSYEFLEKTCKYVFYERGLLFETKNKLQNVISLFNDPSLMLYLSIMIPYQFDKILKPVRILKSNIKDISVQQFKDKCQNKQNCLILTKIKETNTSDYIIYGGFAPDSYIFNQYSNCQSYKTDRIEEWNLPFTFNLNQKIKRNLIHQKNHIAYHVYPSFYLGFNDDFYIQNNQIYYYKYRDKYYKSLDQEEENTLKQMDSGQQFVDVQIEVIQLF